MSAQIGVSKNFAAMLTFLGGGEDGLSTRRTPLCRLRGTLSLAVGQDPESQNAKNKRDADDG